MGERQLHAGRGFGVGLVIGRLPVERAIAGFQHEAGGDGGAVEAQRQRVEPAGAVEGGERRAGEGEPGGIVGERGAARALPALALDLEERLDPLGARRRLQLRLARRAPRLPRPFRAPLRVEPRLEGGGAFEPQRRARRSSGEA